MARAAHVTRKSGGGWKTTRSGKTTSTHKTQRAAISAARSGLKKSRGGELVVHGRDGKIRQKNTIAPAKDPHPPKG